MRVTAIYVFYADVYFVQNLLLKVTVLYLALYVNKQNFRVNPLKIALAGVFGGLLEIGALAWGKDFFFFTGIVNLVEMPLIMFFLLGKDLKAWFNVTVTAWFFVLVVNGVVEAGWNYFGEMGHFMILVLLSCCIVWVGTKWFLQYIKIQKGIYPTEFLHKGKRIKCLGFYDSGNRLKDPYTGAGVHIISGKIGEKLKVTEEKAVLIPYSSLGNEMDLMKVFYLEKMLVYGRKEMVQQTQVAVGVAEDALFLEKEFDLILNENVW